MSDVDNRAAGMRALYEERWDAGMRRCMRDVETCRYPRRRGPVKENLPLLSRRYLSFCLCSSRFPEQRYPITKKGASTTFTMFAFEIIRTYSIP